jgi:HD-like signal output (HDOD) protein
MTTVRWGAPCDVEDVVDAAHSLGAFPASAQRIRELADDPESSLVELERAVAGDPAVTAVVLRVANSAFFGLQRTVVSVKEALLILGFSATKDLAMSVALVGGLRQRDPLGNRVWSGALRTGAAAELIARTVAGVDAQAMFSAGMLHEIGLLVLLKVFARPYGALIQPRYGRPDLSMAEREHLGFTHPELAGACLTQWQIPAAVTSSVRWHAAVLSEPDTVPVEAKTGAGVIAIARMLQMEAATGRPHAACANLVSSHPLAQSIGASAPALERVASRISAEVARWANL